MILNNYPLLLQILWSSFFDRHFVNREVKGANFKFDVATLRILGPRNLHNFYKNLL